MSTGRSYACNQDGKNTPLVLPPAFGLAEIKNETYTAEGPISYWNAYVAVTQMGGQGNFADPRLGIDVKHSPDMVSAKLPALRAYQHSLPTPPPPAGSFDASIARRGRAVFDRTCASCHVGGSGTDNNSGKLHAPADVVAHYNRVRKLGFTAEQQRDLVEYLKSL